MDGRKDTSHTFAPRLVSIHTRCWNNCLFCLVRCPERLLDQLSSTWQKEEESRLSYAIYTKYIQTIYDGAQSKVRANR